MKIPRPPRRTLALIAVVVPLLLLFIYVAARSGPLAPTEVTVSKVESRTITPALFGIGTVEVQYSYKIGPTNAGRLKRLDVHVGDVVKAGQLLGEMDAVDLDDRITAQQAAIKSTEAAFKQALAKQHFAQAQENRYGQLLAVRATSEENAASKHQELAIASAALTAASENTDRQRSELRALYAQRSNLRLVTPVAGLVAAREVDPGTTVVAGQTVVEVIDPKSLWIDTRFDQISAAGLAAGLHAKITLRSNPLKVLDGRVLRIEPRADAVTEETLAKIVFDIPPKQLPPLGELAEITVHMGELPAAPTIPNAALRNVNGKRGVWKLLNGDLTFAPLSLGRTDLEGNVQVLKGLTAGEIIVVYSDKTLSTNSRIHIVERLAGVAP